MSFWATLGSGLLTGLKGAGTFAAANPTLTGMALGAGAGQLAGGNTKSTLGGAALGGALGYGAGQGLFGSGVSNYISNAGQGGYDVLGNVSSGLFGGGYQPQQTGLPQGTNYSIGNTGAGVAQRNALASSQNIADNAGRLANIDYSNFIANTGGGGRQAGLLGGTGSILGPTKQAAESGPTSTSFLGGLFSDTGAKGATKASQFADYAKGLGSIGQTYSAYKSAKDQKDMARDQMMLNQLNYNREFDLSQKGFDQQFAQNEQQMQWLAQDRERARLEAEYAQSALTGQPVTTIDEQGNVIASPAQPVGGMQGAFANSALANMYA